MRFVAKRLVINYVEGRGGGSLSFTPTIQKKGGGGGLSQTEGGWAQQVSG